MFSDSSLTCFLSQATSLDCRLYGGAQAIDLVFLFPTATSVQEIVRPSNVQLKHLTRDSRSRKYASLLHILVCKYLGT